MFLLWLDLETTGSDELEGDEIIEVACFLTHSTLEDVAEFAPVSEVVIPTDAALARMLKIPIVREMHAKNGLLWEVCDGKGKSLTQVESLICDRLRLSAGLNKVMLAGSGVGHFDRRFIRKYMPQLDDKLAYAAFDVGAVRRMFKYWNIPLPLDNKDQKPHRALDDALLHLEEARAYKKLFEGHLRFESGQTNRQDV